MAGVRFPAGDLSLLHSIKMGFEALKMDTGGSFPQGEAADG
jgi:hypothetical protein